MKRFSVHPASASIIRPGIAMQRRTALGMGATAILTWMGCNSAQAADPKAAANASNTLTKVRTVVELSGEVYLRPAPDAKSQEPKSVPIQAKSNLDYDEELRRGTNAACAQYYHAAEVENSIGKHTSRERLRSESKLVYRAMVNGQLVTNAVDQPLTRDELDLIEGPIASLFLDELLPRTSVKLDSVWEPSDETLQRVFNLDAVQASTVKIRLQDVDGDKANLELQGNITASTRSVPTTLNIQGTAKVDRKLNMITWLAMVIEENREIGEAEPGFKITARIRVLRATNDQPTSQHRLVAIESKKGDASASILQFQSEKGRYRFIADRAWHTLTDNGMLSTMRMVKNNTVIAQCNVTNLPDLDAGYQLTLEGFREDIRKSLGELVLEFREGSEKVTESGLRMLRVTSAGQVEGVPIEWINLHLSDDHGRHVSMVFTMNASNANSFGGADEQMASSFELLPRSTGATTGAETSKLSRQSESVKSR